VSAERISLESWNPVVYKVSTRIKKSNKTPILREFSIQDQSLVYGAQKILKTTTTTGLSRQSSISTLLYSEDSHWYRHCCILKDSHWYGHCLTLKDNHWYRHCCILKDSFWYRYCSNLKDSHWYRHCLTLRTVIAVDIAVFWRAVIDIDIALT